MKQPWDVSLPGMPEPKFVEPPARPEVTNNPALAITADDIARFNQK